VTVVYHHLDKVSGFILYAKRLAVELNRERASECMAREEDTGSVYWYAGGGGGEEEEYIVS